MSSKSIEMLTEEQRKLHEEFTHCQTWEEVEEFLKEDGSLDVEKINRLSLEERFDAIGSLTKKQLQEYLSKQPINESKSAPRSIYVDKPMEEWGVDAMEYLNKLKR